ncbi:MAG: citrate transporter [Candidatus Latescibacteria bacterium]|nr:citrate transporter [Candidatus Latescibacterota bacterium]
MRGEFLLFALTLVGVALFHHYTLQVALLGLGSILLFKLAFVPSFHLVEHLHHEWNILLNLLGLLLGFALLARHFEESRIPEILPRFLPDDWKGGFALLGVIFVLSSFLDNIAAAMIGGTIALVVFKGRVHIGYLAAIVAASNAGGAGSVLGDTTTTMMWIDGVAVIDVIHAYVAAVPCLFLFGILAALQQHRFQPIQKDEVGHHQVDWVKILVVALILAGAIATNVLLDFPALGVWVAILIGSLLSKTAWGEIPAALKGSLFLICLVLCASMMPVDQLPVPSWQSAFALGFISAVFDNIPLTKLALDQGGYDWGVLAYTVGFGGSMVWFGSSAGVALSNIFPQAKSVGAWLRHGWSVVAAYVLSFFIMLALWGWQPHEPHKENRLISTGQVQH